MAKIKYDVSDVEASGGGGTEEPRPAIYPARIARVTQRTQKRSGEKVNDLEMAFDLGGNYRWLYTYIGLDANSNTDWKLRQLTDALGLKPTGTLDTDKMEGKMIRLKVNPDSYEDAYRARAGNMYKAQDGDEIPEATDEGEPSPDDDSEPDEPEAEAAAGTGYPDDYEPVREDADSEIGSYDDWSDKDVADELSDRGLEVPGGRGDKRAKMIKALRADDESPQEAEGGEGPANEYRDWTLEELVDEARKRGLKLGRGKKSEEDIIALLEADDNEDPFV